MRLPWVRLGEIFQSDMVNTAQFPVGFTDGEAKGYGNGCGRISSNKLMLFVNIDWEVHFIDSTVVRAHQHAAGAKKGDQKCKLWD